MPSIIALDSECTGLDIRHGCRPFIVSTCTDTGETTHWQWHVNPHTRMPEIPDSNICEIDELLNNVDTIVMHNTKFDVRVLESIGIDFSPYWHKIQDTLCCSHVLDSIEPHGLKYLAGTYCAIPDDDESKMRIAVNKCRRIARKHSWRIAGEYAKINQLPDKTPDPLFPSLRKAPKDGWWVLDMWLPRAVLRGLANDPRVSDDFDDITLTYALRDAERTILLYLFQQKILAQEPSLQKHYQDHIDLLPVVYASEEHGIPLKMETLHSERRRYLTVARDHEIKAIKVIHSLAEAKHQPLQSRFNTNSPQQMQHALYDLFNLPVINLTAKGKQPSTTQDTMQTLLDEQHTDNKTAIDFIQNVIGLRKSLKMEQYLAGYQDTTTKTKSRNGKSTQYRLHPNANQTGTGTTRFSYTNPNTQNVSKKDDRNIRCVFGPAPGRVWYSIDYENIEMRILSYAANVQGFIEIFERGESVHMAVAREIWPIHEVNHPDFKRTDKYRWTKNGNFAVPYGAGEEKGDATYKRPGAYKILNEKFNIKPFEDLMRKKIKEARKDGFITTIGGYRLYVPPERPYAALNYFVQGTAGLICKRAMINCHNYFRRVNLNAHIIMNVHDELVFDFPRHHRKKHIRAIKECMESPGFELNIPSTVSIDKVTVSWDKGEEIEV